MRGRLSDAGEFIALAAGVENGLAHLELRFDNAGGEVESLVEQLDKLGVDAIDMLTYFF